MLTPRQQQILRVIIEDYIATAHPVGSKTIMQKLQFTCSSATIRNECAQLEKLRFLAKAYESSGRIPSTAGYRYYVDHLMNITESKMQGLKQEINQLFNDRHLKVQDILTKISVLLSSSLKLTGIVVSNTDQNETIERVELVPLNQNKMVFLFITSSGKVSNKTIDTKNLDPNDLMIAVQLFNKRLQGTYIHELSTKFNLIKSILAQQITNYEGVLQQFTEALLGINQVYYSMQGVQYMLENPEFANPQKIQQTLNFIETMSPFEGYTIQNNRLQSTKIRIGRELSKAENLDISLFTTTYKADHQQNSLAFIGPKRIDYQKLSNILNWIGHKISKKYGEDNHQIPIKLLTTTRINDK